MMITKFTSHYRNGDIKKFYRFRMKVSGQITSSYIFFLIFFGLFVFDAINAKEATDWVFPLLMLLFVVAQLLCNFLIIPGINEKQYQKYNSIKQTESEVIIYNNALEVNTLPREHCGIVRGIYPYSMMAAVYEAEECYYFLINSNEVRIVKKAEIPKEALQIVQSTIKKQPNYRFVK